ncbi:MAG: helix-turn-helix domain-containing protein [Patescibacteria group bacterium]|nr:helix-turn-helix domain-containing protein [Patescibacteria group bacterium]
MSILQMVAVWGCDVSIVEQAILMALADHAHDDGTKVYPSVARIAWKVGASRATVQRVLQRLRSSGVLVVVHQGGGRDATEYTLHLELLPQKRPLMKRDPPHSEAGTCLTVRQEGPQPEAGSNGEGPQPEAPGASQRGGSRLTAVRHQPSYNLSYNRQSARASGAPTTDGGSDAGPNSPQDPPAAATPPGKQQRASRLPESFELTPDRRAMALAEGLDADRTFAKFCDHWRAAPEGKARKADWDATWRNWCRTEADKIAGITPKPTPAQKAISEERRALLALMERREAIGIAGFRDPYAGETADHYRVEQNAEWDKRKCRPQPRFPESKAVRT